MGRYRLLIRKEGFRPKEVELVVKGDTTVVVLLFPEVVVLPELTVEQERIASLPVAPASVLTVGPRELDIHRGQTLGELIRTIPGAGSISTGPGIAKPMLRGLTGERLLVLNDKVPIYGQSWGEEHAPELDPLQVGAVEVLRGTAAVQYGTEALAGVIRFIPASILMQPGLRWQVRLEGFSGNRQGAAAFWAEGAQGRWGYQALLSARKAADVEAPRYGLANTAFEQYNATAVLQYSPNSDASLRGRLQLFRGRLGIFAGMHLGNLSDLERAFRAVRPLVERPPSYRIEPPYQHVSHVTGELSAKGRFSAGGGWSFQMSWQQNRRQEYDAHRFWNDSLRYRAQRAAYDVTLTTWSMRAEVERLGLGGLMSFAVDARRQGNVSEGLQRLVPNFQSYLLGAGIWQQWFWQDWKALVGLRADLVWLTVWRSVQGKWYGRSHRWGGGAFSVTLQRAWRRGELRGGIATGWRAPNVLELYAYGVHHGAAIFEAGDTTLRSERLWVAEVGGLYRGTGWQIDATGFLYWFPRYIARVPTGTPVLTIRGAFPGFQYQAVPAAIVGAEMQYQMELLPWLRIELQSTFLRGWRTANREALYGIPPARLEGRLHAHGPAVAGVEHVFVELEVTAVGRAWQTPLDFAPPPPGYVLLGGAFGGETRLDSHILSFGLQVRNLFNRAYRDYTSRLRYFADEPGRTLMLRLGWQW